MINEVQETNALVLPLEIDLNNLLYCEIISSLISCKGWPFNQC